MLQIKLRRHCRSVRGRPSTERSAGSAPPQEPLRKRILPGGAPLSTLALGLVLVLSACAPPDPRELLITDVHPPRFLSAEAVGRHELVLRFDRPAAVIPGYLRIEPALEIESVSDGTPTVRVRFAESAEIGQEYLAEVAVRDEDENSLHLIAPFYGYNPDLPEVVINELNPRGSGNNPEIVELYVRQGGNLGGATLTNGTADDYDTRYVFPGLPVETGEFILVHFRPEGLEEEIDELGEEWDISDGLNTTEAARSLWVPEGSGLPTNNGAVVLNRTPAGGIMDAVLYTNRTSDSDERYRGFGTARMVEWVDHVVSEGGWRIEGSEAAPEDLVYVGDSTATRSLNRSRDSVDTDHRSDWHTVPTRGATWGEPNLDDVYTP